MFALGLLEGHDTTLRQDVPKPYLKQSVICLTI
jgi:hypothetical protein